MKFIKLPLPDSAYQKALELAAANATPLEAYLLTQIQDMLDKNHFTSSTSTSLADEMMSPKTAPAPSFRATMPDTLEQVLSVCKYVYKDKVVPKDEMYAKNQYREGLRLVAETRGINETTVRDKFHYRRLGLPGVDVNLDVIISWLCKPELLRDHLCRKFPNCVSVIHQHFGQFLPQRFDGPN